MTAGSPSDGTWTPTRIGRRLLALLAAVVAACLIAAPRIAPSWGAGGREYVAALAVNDLPNGPLRTLYQTNLAWLETNSSFPERWRERGDLAEPSREYLHPEIFAPDATPRQVSQRYADVVRAQGYLQTRDVGVLPWTVERHYKLLVAAWSDRQWDAVFFESAMLSYYVANTHSPFRATANDDGQLSDPPQTGIRSRSSTELIDREIRLANLRSASAAYIRDPVARAFDDLQDSDSHVSALLDADRKALAASANTTYDADYWAAFTPVARPIAIGQLQSAGRTLAGLLLRAWAEAGHPAPPADFLMTDRYLPFAPPIVRAGQQIPPSQPYVSDRTKDDAQANGHPVTVASNAMNGDVAATVLLPGDYGTTNRRYPVLYILHGSSGSERDWIAKSGVAAYVQDLPLIVVMPDGGDSWYVDSPGQGKYESFFVDELIPAIDRQFRTVAGKEARAIAGNSMGGYGAWRLALDHPELFATAASLSGAMDMGVVDPHDGEPNEWITTLYGSTDPGALRSYHRDSLYPRLDRLNPHGSWRGPWLYFDAGGDDYLLSGDQHMEQFLLSRGIPYEYAEFTGGAHDWNYWDEHIRDALQFTLRHLAAPTGR